MPQITLTGMTLAANDVPAMIAFYNAVFEAGLTPRAAFSTPSTRVSWAV